MIPKIAIQLKQSVSNYGGWFTSLSEDLCALNKHTLLIVFPFKSISGKTVSGKTENYEYASFPTDKGLEKYDHNVTNYFMELLKQYIPDVIHVFGTEYPHTLSMIKAAQETNLINKLIIHIQGMPSIYSKHYSASLPNSVINSFSLRDFLKRDNMKTRYMQFIRMGKHEVLALSKAHHVFGRTRWDFACTKQINPNINYHLCNESLRLPFYEKEWEYSQCVKNTIFISQASSPIKGFHYLLEAVSIVVKKYPNLKVFVAGAAINKIKWYKLTSYQKYILNLIKKLHLENKIVFTGPLDENLMSNELVKSNVFVSPSSIENSPNSLGEAMMLGVPCISSYVGGVPDMMTHDKEGFLYQADAPYMLAFYIDKVFSSNEEELLLMSNLAKERARARHNRQEILTNLISAYTLLSANGSETDGNIEK